MSDLPTKETLRIYNVGQAGIAFALNEETGKTVFLSRQLCQGMGVEDEDVGRFITAMVGEGSKGPQALTFDWVDDEVEDDVLEALEKRVEALEKAVWQDG